MMNAGASDHSDGALAASPVRLALLGRLLLQQAVLALASYVPDVPVPPGWVQSS
jgi:hypothetical protein